MENPNKDQNSAKIREEPIEQQENDLEYYDFTQDTEIKIENNEDMANSQNSNIGNVENNGLSNQKKTFSHQKVDLQIEKPPIDPKLQSVSKISQNNFGTLIISTQDTDIKKENNEGTREPIVENLKIIIEESFEIENDPLNSKCSYCNETFVNDEHLYSKLKSHLAYQHNIQSPSKKVKSAHQGKNNEVESYSEHKSLITVIQLGLSISANFQCNFCTTTFTEKGSMDRHKDNFHPDEFEEEKRKKNEEKDILAAFKAARMESNSIIRCDFCEEVFPLNEMQDHIAKAHEGKNPLLDDTEVHERNKPVQAVIGNDTTSEMEQNYEAKNNDNSGFNCIICNNDDFKSKREMLFHVVKTHKKDLYECENSNCGKKFALEDHLKYHTASAHQKNKCYVCGAKFRQLTKLEDHFIRHHGTTHDKTIILSIHTKK